MYRFKFFKYASSIFLTTISWYGFNFTFMDESNLSFVCDASNDLILRKYQARIVIVLFIVMIVTNSITLAEMK